MLPLDLLNLLCASGLPDTAILDIDACLKMTGRLWAAHVGRESERNYHRFQSRSGMQYRHSEAYYRVIMLVTVLQEDCGVRYDPDCVKSSLFLDSGEGFLARAALGPRPGHLRESARAVCRRGPPLGLSDFLVSVAAARLLPLDEQGHAGAVQH